MGWEYDTDPPDEPWQLRLFLLLLLLLLLLPPSRNETNNSTLAGALGDDCPFFASPLSDLNAHQLRRSPPYNYAHISFQDKRRKERAKNGDKNIYFLKKEKESYFLISTSRKKMGKRERLFHLRPSLLSSSSFLIHFHLIVLLSHSSVRAASSCSSSYDKDDLQWAELLLFSYSCISFLFSFNTGSSAEKKRRRRMLYTETREFFGRQSDVQNSFLVTILMALKKKIRLQKKNFISSFFRRRLWL